MSLCTVYRTSMFGKTNYSKLKFVFVMSLNLKY